VMKDDDRRLEMRRQITEYQAERAQPA
jgi:hypothetical protein